MLSSIVLSGWNLKAAFSDPKRVKAALDTVLITSPDVIVFPDAWHEDSERSIPTTRHLLLSDADFQQRGYTPLKTYLRDDRPDDNYARYGFLTLYKTDTTPLSAVEVYLGFRSAHHLRYAFGDTTLNVITLYLNDQSEENRLVQVQDLLNYLVPYQNEPTVILGDFNAMHKKSAIGWVLQNKLFRASLGKLSIANNTFPRLVEMASGTTLQTLEANGFYDAEPENIATMPSQLPVFQLDRCMVRDPYGLLQVKRPARISRPKVSDHIQILTTVSVK
ncbi:MAG: endonuclease/exonuclease/phosphatase family protein [Candidatus Microsaccharimonas sp.]